jgi:hypothetical protein
VRSRTPDDGTASAPPGSGERRDAASPSSKGDTETMTLSVIRQHLQTAGEHVGDLLWWTLEDARISRSRLEAVWAAAALSPNFLPEPPTPEKALKTAVRECQVGQHNHLIRLGKEDDAELVFAVLQEKRDGIGNVDLEQEAKITLDRAAPSQLRSDAPAHDLVRAISDSYDRLLNTHTPDDVRRALVKTLSSCAGITLREHGGVYWVPAPYAETLRQLQRAVSNIGRSRLDLVPIHATPEAQQALGDAARSALEEDLSELREEIDGFLKAPPDRAATLVRRLQMFDELRGKARLYQSILQVQVTDLEAKLNELTLHVEGMLQAKAS